MKKYFALFLIISSFSTLIASAKNDPYPAACYKRCTSTAILEKHDDKIKRIQAQLKIETDPEKIKILEKDEKIAIDKHKEAIKKECKKMCSYED